ncbi:tyrosine-type recombinase/integrase [Bradyrhizobium sp. 2S1]|uniref:tyrosine-type recombinase/integrase n=1 Tax=Bradyrhizobium sp. 2S1 TaxID=1404429 RepID=UPI0014094E2E|nr:integrase family protein [Bradyrhizobium sp. 2S1]MCK7665838.1 integrase family protein [Bradyrhizobium sp. 2S1]
MASGNITISAVRALAPSEAIWDAGHREAVRGFGVRKQKNAAIYVLKYRAHGRQRFYTIGAHGSPWTPETARRKAKQLLGRVADGKDPADEKKQSALRDADTLRKIIDRYLKHAKQKQKPRSYVETERHLLINWKSLHSASAFHIHRRHVALRLAEIAEGQGLVAASHARAALSAMFNWAIREGLDLPANPVLGTNRPAGPKSRDRVLTDTELAEIWSACGDDDYGRIVRLLILTAQRRDEIGGLRWDEIATEVDAATLLPISAIRLPPARTKNRREHLFPLVPLALALLPARRNDRDHVFGDGPRRDGDPQRGFSGWSKSKAALDARILAARKVADPEAKPLPHWTVHDLRRSAATGLADQLGVLPHIVEAILNHVSGHRAGVAGVYNRARYHAEMRDALDRWADHVARITSR